MPFRPWRRWWIGAGLIVALCAGCAAPVGAPPTESPASLSPAPATATAEPTSPRLSPSPPPPPTPAPLAEAEAAALRELAAEHGFSYFLTMLASDDTVRALAADWPVTFLAPTDRAFLVLPAERQLALVADDDERLAVVMRHTLAGAYSSAQLAATGALATLDGAALSFTQGPSGVQAGGALILVADLETRIGTIHIIDRVLPTP